MTLPEVVSVSANVLSALQFLELGTVCHLMLSQRTLLRHSKPSYFRNIILTFISHIVFYVIFCIYFICTQLVRRHLL